jgi:hypothetical protein
MILTKKLGLAFMGTALLCGTLTQAHAEERPAQLDVYYLPMHFVFDGKEMAPPEGQKGFLYQDTTYVPLRFVSYALNKNVNWEADTYTVSVSEPSSSRDKSIIEDYNLNRVVHDPDRTTIDWSSLTTTKIEAYLSKVNYLFDGKEKHPDEDKVGMIIEDSLYVPIRFLSESVGKEIGFDAATYTVTATTATTTGEHTGTETGTPEGTKGSTPITGGTGAGTAQKPTYDSLIQAAESQISTLKSSAESTFNGLVSRYKAAKTAEEKGTLITEGVSTLSSYDNQFEAIMSDLSSKLSTNGYDTSIIQTYRTQYSDMKAAKQQQVLGAL